MISRLTNAYLLYPLMESLQKRVIRSKVKTLREQWDQPFERRKTKNAKALLDTLCEAGEKVPYYRDLFASLSFDPQKLTRDLRYLEELPFLTKDILREQGDRMLHVDFDKESLHLRKTGGSTGASTLIYYADDGLDWTAAVNLAVLEAVGKPRHFREVHLSTVFSESIPLMDRVKESIKCAALNRVNVLTSAFDDESMASLWSELKRARATLVHGHPSTLVALARYLKQAGIAGVGAFSIFESTGESLDQRKRSLIEEIFGCRVVNRFGSAEVGVFAYELGREPNRPMQVLDNVVWFEIDDAPSESDVDDLDIGEIVLTSLLNPAMPLIRYRTGDLGKSYVTDDGIFLEDVFGRTHDLVQLQGRSYPTHYIQDILDRLGHVDDFQIQLRNEKVPLLKIIPNCEANVERLSILIHEEWGDAFEVVFTDYAGIQRSGWRGKFSYLASPEDDS